MAILVRGNKEKPPWLDETRDFCRRAGISIVGWGSNMLTVEAKSPDRATEIASQLGQLGFKVVRNEDDEYAGLLNLSQDPDAVQAAISQANCDLRYFATALAGANRAVDLAHRFVAANSGRR